MNNSELEKAYDEYEKLLDEKNYLEQDLADLGERKGNARDGGDAAKAAGPCAGEDRLHDRGRGAGERCARGRTEEGRRR